MRNDKPFNTTLFTLSECHFENGSQSLVGAFLLCWNVAIELLLFQLLAHHAVWLEDLFEFLQNFDSASTRSLWNFLECSGKVRGTVFMFILGATPRSMDIRKARNECELKGYESYIYHKNCRLQLRKQIGRIQKTELTLISSLKRNLQMFVYGIFICVFACVFGARVCCLHNCHQEHCWEKIYSQGQCPNFDWHLENKTVDIRSTRRRNAQL